MVFPSTSSMSSQSVSDTAHAWHTLEVEQALDVLQADPDKGLTPDQIIQRQQQFGLNELQETRGRSTLEILWDQFTNIMLVMLIAVALVSGFLDLRQSVFPKDAIAIFAIVILNGVLGYLQESRAEKALAALKRLSSPRVRVVRDDNIIEVAGKELVPGDVMLLEAGVQIAADGRLIEAQNLQVREAALTGEAEAVNKQPRMQLNEDAPLGDRINLVFQGTEVVQGRAKVLVTHTGMKTELGRIAEMLQSVESEPTPLQQRMSQLGNVLVTGSLILVALVVIGGVLRLGWGSFEELLEVSLSMAVAVVPEGLPAVVTVTLAIGTQRMVRHNALIRKLPAVETLGSVTTICSDKTGTLTQNKMVVQLVHTGSNSLAVTGDGYAPTGNFTSHHSDTTIEDLENYSDLQTLLTACVVCNDAILQQEKNQWMILGDPTEGALLSLAGKAGLFRESLNQQLPRVAEFPFSSERKRMSVICQSPTELKAGRLNVEGSSDSAQPSNLQPTNLQPTNLQPSNLQPTNLQPSNLQPSNLQPSNPQPTTCLMFTKGSPELILERCTHIQMGHQVQFLNHEQRHRVLEQNNQMAAKGLRVLGFSYKSLDALPAEGSDETTEQRLVWLGLVGMLDAPRPEVRGAVARCRDAGIRPVMITGDHQLTAKAIAQDLGIATEADHVLTGQQLEKLSQTELEQEVKNVSIYARVSPEHKLRIVQALQSRHEFVAMTGDGVNDAPALKQADIGVAMGITGTDVSKEASDMILLDDNFATIVQAVEEGRVVYTNIRRFIKYILGSNIGEVLTIAAAPLIGLGGVPLTPLQILWMNLVTDGLPALALAMEPAEPNVMKRPPYDPRESIFARGLGLYMIRIGIILAILSIALMAWAYNHAHTVEGNPERWKTMVFTTLCLAQMGHALAIRSNTRLTIQLNPFSNPYILAAVTLTSVLQLMLIYVEPLRNFFGTHLLSPLELWICLGFSVLMFVWIELEKLFINWFHKR